MWKKTNTKKNTINFITEKKKEKRNQNKPNAKNEKNIT